MAALAGRRVRVQLNGVDVAGARADNITFNREHIDTTDKDDEGVRHLLDEIGVYSVTMSLSGIIKDDVLLAWGADPTEVLNPMSFVIEGIGTVAGDFGMSSFNPGGNDGAEAATFEATFESAGDITYTAA